ncbi:MAG: capsid cement protein [Planctomycetaceae bacterium]
MAVATFRHAGAAIDYTPGAAVAAGDVVVQGELVGVANADIPANALGALAVQGVFDFPKATGVGTAITVGSTVYWDATAQEATTSAAAGANKLIGKTVIAAVDNDTTVRARLNQ